MIKQYIIFEKDQYFIDLQLDDDNFDYYSDVEIKIIVKGTEYIIYKDNLLFLKNVINNFNEKNECIDDNLEDKQLGILLNIYYKMVYDELVDERIRINEFGEWIGEKNVFFSSKSCATWLYRNRDKNILKITPIFNNNDEYGEEFVNFMIDYQDILNDELYANDLKRIFNVLLDIIELYLK